MIDIHVHVIPGVDDGPSTIEDSIAMIKMMYEDGVRHIIATPHRNHSLKFKGETEILTAYETLKQSIAQIYPDFQIELGCELYIRDGYIDILDDKDESLQMHQSDYILVEYTRDATLEYILNSVHELKIRGYKPIIAHIEMYAALMETSAIEALREKGANVQITASSLTGKQGKETRRYIQSLIAAGYVDFVASDGHSAKKRRPILSKAYADIAKNFGENFAEKLFVENQEKVLANAALTANPILKKIKYKNPNKVSLNLVASVLAVLCIGAAGIGVWYKQETAIAKKSELMSQLEYAYEDTTKAGLETQVERITTAIEDQETKTQETESETQVEPETKDKTQTQLKVEASIKNATAQSIDKTKEKEEVFDTYEKVYNHYEKSLLNMEAVYETELAAIVDQILIAKHNITDEEKKNAIVNAYIDEIVDLEVVVDKKVYDELYEMQNKLESLKAEVTQVQVLRDRYNATKQERKEFYVDKIVNQ